MVDLGGRRVQKNHRDHLRVAATPGEPLPADPEHGDTADGPDIPLDALPPGGLEQQREEAEDTAPDEPEHITDGELDAYAPQDPGEAPCPAETAPRGEAPESEPPPLHEEPTETHTTSRRRRRGRPRHARCRVTEDAGDDSDDPAGATPDPEPIISDPDEDEEESPPSPTRGGWGGWTSPSDTTLISEAAGVRPDHHPGAELTQPGADTRAGTPDLRTARPDEPRGE
ncbi:fibrous sheath CABYR-binding protein-like [Bacillus rossius redtenbacheri]|uniref:fibrous sheath CABYR-binding protein-like n=1 Tax=Bacillus rossius redtenbacheri TaxID=93214 RepID=UPI002FDEB810